MDGGPSHLASESYAHRCFERGAEYAGVRGDASPVLDGGGALVHQHAEAVEWDAGPCCRFFQEARLDGIEYDISDDNPFSEGVEFDVGEIIRSVEAYAGRIDERID